MFGPLCAAPYRNFLEERGGGISCEWIRLCFNTQTFSVPVAFFFYFYDWASGEGPPKKVGNGSERVTWRHKKKNKEEVNSYKYEASSCSLYLSPLARRSSSSIGSFIDLFNQTEVSPPPSSCYKFSPPLLHTSPPSESEQEREREREK